jgi:type IV pilus assembly protein PilY1
MVTPLRKTLYWVLACLGSLGAASQALADDTEIYFSQAALQGTAVVRPNIMFVLDTSGSMRNEVPDSGGKNRLQVMQEALNAVLDSASGVNVGLMRFHEQGGPVLFPVSNIDAAVGGVEGVRIDVGASSDDATEVTDVSSSAQGQVSLTIPVLGLGEAVVDGVTVQYQINDTSNDAEERPDGSMYRTSSDLELVREGSNDQTIGLRFRNIAVPQGATIQSAYLEFVIDEYENQSTSLTIEGHDTDDASYFGSSNGDVTGRSRTSAAVDWNGLPAPSVGETLISPDISTVVKEIVDRGGWASGNDMAFIISGTGKRTVESYDGMRSSAPKLKITYCEICTSSALTVGVRFTGVDIPQGATINSAVIEFTAQAGGENGAASFVIQAEASDSAPTFAATDGNLSGRGLSTAAVNWDGVASWSSAGTRYQTPDLTTIVTEISSRDGWCGGQDMVFLISGTGTRTAWSYDGSAGSAPKLTVNYDPGSVTSSSCGSVGPTVRARLKETVNALQHGGWTPIVSTLYEAALYYRGEEVFFGRTRGSGPTYPYPHDARTNAVSHPDSHVSHATSYLGGTISLPTGCSSSNSTDSSCLGEEIQSTPVYRSPMEATCQGNYIVMLSDGFPTRNYAEQLLENGWIGQDCAGGGDGECGPELTEFLRTVDQGSSAALTGDQFVETYTIGFNIEASGADYLKSLVEDETKQYFDASSAADVVDAFATILSEIRDDDNSFVAPSASVNAFNRLTHRDEIYYALFQPSTTARWTGNLKRYRLQGGSSAGIYDANDELAIDATTSLFVDTAQSFWSDVVDGNEVGTGGAANELTVSRNLYTYTGGYSSLGSSGVNLNDTSGAYDISEANTTNITKALLNIPAASDTYHQELLKWASGVEEVDDGSGGTIDQARKYMGDALHSVPVLANYGGTADNPDITVFMSTNEGYLQAFSTADGSEYFSFMPKELLRNLDTLYRNTHSADDRPYGMDGAITLWVNDADNDGVIESLDGDFVYLYATMRRGGRNIYALNVTDRANPVLKWVLEGGSGDFATMGETWSRPRLATIQYQGSPRKVLVFGGGYDSDQDSAVTRQADAMGNAIYIVDAASGQRLWWAGSDNSADLSLAAMVNGIVAEIRVIDVNGNGLADRFYTGDMGGRIWRIDLDETHGSASSDLALGGGVLADLNGGDAAGNRRFYYPPDVAKINKSGGYLSIAIGSGYRAHPLNQTIQDRFYVLRDTDVYTRPDFTNPGYAPIQESDLYDTTTNLIAEGTDLQRTAAHASLAGSRGWYMNLEGSGEKVLAESVTFDHKILFSSFTPVPPTGQDQLCSVATSNAKLYVVSVHDGTAVAELDGTDSGGLLTKGDRVYQLASAGIAPEPKLFFVLADYGDGDTGDTGDDGSGDNDSGDNGTDEDESNDDVGLPDEVLVLVGRERVPITFPLTLTKTYWQDN